jgi:type I restriction enzyme S subunit
MGSIDVLSEYEIGMVSPAYKVFEISNPEISAEYMKALVRSEIMLECLIGSSVVGASIVRRNLDRETLYEWSFRVPNFAEQTSIAKALQAADKEISLLKAKAEKLREQKKGLMQQLLTGKVRLKI